MRELYFYWRARPGSVEPALAAARDLQRRLLERLPGLRARLLRRAEGDPGTLMEIYTREGGIDERWRRLLQDEGDAVLDAWLDGTRHLEVFEPVER